MSPQVQVGASSLLVETPPHAATLTCYLTNRSDTHSSCYKCSNPIMLFFTPPSTVNTVGREVVLTCIQCKACSSCSGSAGGSSGCTGGSRRSDRGGGRCVDSQGGGAWSSPPHTPHTAETEGPDPSARLISSEKGSDYILIATQVSKHVHRSKAGTGSATDVTRLISFY